MNSVAKISPGGALDVSPGQALRSPGKAPKIDLQPCRGAGDRPFIRKGAKRAESLP